MSPATSRAPSRRTLLWIAAGAAAAALLVAWASACAGSGAETRSLPPWPGDAAPASGDAMTDPPTAPVLRLYGEILEGTISPAVLPRLDELYAGDVRFRDPIKDLSGFDALRTYYAEFLELAEGGTFTIDRWIEEGGEEAGEAALTWTLCLPGEEEPGRRCFGGMSHVIHRDGRITAQRDYFDMGEAVYEQVGVLRWIHRRVKSRF